MMKLNRIFKSVSLVILVAFFTACTGIEDVTETVNNKIPESFFANVDTVNSATVNWKEYFQDPYLTTLIDTALKNNQELKITLQEIEIARNEIGAKKGEYLPFLSLGAGAGVDKVGRYTSQGANDANTDIAPGKATPDPLGNYTFGAYATWELDIWKKLRNAKKAAVMRYLGSVQGKNFMVTQLIAEISNSYYELLALDNQLEILNQNIEIQTNALEIVKLQKQSAKVSELAVRRFEAQVLKTQSLQFEIQQQIIETENKINFLVGRFPQKIERDSKAFHNLMPRSVQEGIPSQLLSNRPDIQQAEFELQATQLDVKVAKARFYPSISLSAGIGLEAFDPTYLVKSPESMLYSLGGDLVAPLVNRKALKANYRNANARQLQAIYEYDKTVLKAFVEVSNQLSRMKNLEQSYALKEKQVDALTKSIDISNDLFKSARADYMEVLLTQRDALESKFELIETKKKQMNSVVNIYKALGGGWKE